MISRDLSSKFDLPLPATLLRRTYRGPHLRYQSDVVQIAVLVSKTVIHDDGIRVISNGNRINDIVKRFGDGTTIRRCCGRNVDAMYRRLNN